MSTQSIFHASSRSLGALVGLYVGDALAMPAHWYYNREALRRDYGRITDYTAPKHPHPDSILWRSSYQAPNAKGEILHDQARYWGQKGIHYHQFLRPGESTLNLQLCSLLVASLLEKGRYDASDYLERYIHFMTTPGMHRDTYIEECHRHFFFRYAMGVPPLECGAQEKHIGGLPGIVPLVIFYQEEPGLALDAALTHLSITHKGALMEGAARLLVRLLLDVLGGKPLREVLWEAVRRQVSPFLGHPFQAWLEKPDEVVVGAHLSTACYVEDSVPAVVHLALKYAEDPERGLIANTGLGGDNAYRGAVLGALLGAGNGIESLPDRWVRGLVLPPPVPV